MGPDPGFFTVEIGNFCPLSGHMMLCHIEGTIRGSALYVVVWGGRMESMESSYPQTRPIIPAAIALRGLIM